MLKTRANPKVGNGADVNRVVGDMHARLGDKVAALFSGTSQES